jgi:hypothetical protein
MTSPTLFDFAAARHADPPTSKAAAASLEPERVTSLMQKVLDAISDLGGAATIEAVADHTGLSLVSVSPRFRPLARLGKIADTQQRRQNRSGRSAVVWGLTG